MEFQVDPEGQLRGRRGSGGVVTALNTLTQNIDFTWIANAMSEGDRAIVEASEGANIKSPMPGHKLSLRYVVTPRRVYHKFYNVFCNPLLWFLQHYMWSSPYTPNVDSSVHDAWEGGYVAINKAFAESVIVEAEGSETAPYVVIHDYHLYLVPKYVRQAVPNATICQFVHIPWPSPAYWLLLPSYIRESICRSMCQSDIVGFQCLRDARAFLQTCEEFLPDAVVDYKEMSVELDGRKVCIRVYPISIDPFELRRIADSPRSLEYEKQLEPLCLENTIVRVDRLEPSKNLIRGFRAYELLLQRHPELHKKVTFLAFLAPSRTRVRQYQRYGEEVQQHVQNVNNTYGTDTWTPIQTFYENNYTQAIAGLRLYDVLLVNPVIDGMNLVAKEGPVVNTKEGVVVLSESVGAHDQLKGGALSVSPTDVEGTMQAMHDAIAMSRDERSKRSSSMTEVVENEDVTNWLKLQFEDMLNLN